MKNQNNETRRKRANDARLSALTSKAEQKELSQMQIKNSLLDLDKAKKNASHIQFSDSEESDTESPLPSDVKKDVLKNNSEKLLGFSSDSDHDAEMCDEIRIKPQFEGKAGERLLELQSRYGNDARFRLDERFAENEEDISVVEGNLEENNLYVPMETETRDLKSEVAKNMEVLGKVVGHKVESVETSRKQSARFVDSAARRYDPARSDHLEIKQKEKEVLHPKRKKKKKEDEMPEVDKKRYYETSTDALKNAFADNLLKKHNKSRTSDTSTTKESDCKPFSFLEMMGRNKDSDSDSVKGILSGCSLSENFNSEGKSLIKKHSIPTLKQPFEYDSSETDEGEEMETEPEADVEQHKAAKKAEKTKSNYPNTFFLTSRQDPRIADGVRAFCLNKSYVQMQQEWLAVKDNLIQDYKKKHRDAKRKAKSDARHQYLKSERN